MEIGLPIFGVASPEPFSELEDLLKARRESGRESPFEKRWCEKTRCSPKLVFPEVRSVICVGLPYFQPDVYGASEEPRWSVSRFAWGKDYHVVLREKLEKLAVFLKQQVGPEFKYFACVDSVPLIERALAFRAGLGWYGKNNLLVNPEYGSWFVLGELLVNISLPPDSPIEGECGDCEACIRACPSGALEQFDLDAGKCISCMTQISRPIASELRAYAGRSLFGCDICQEVCPKNHKILHMGKGEVTPLVFTGEGLAELLEITEEEFRERFGSTGFAWGGRDLLQRNAVIALGSTGMEKYIPPLSKALVKLAPQVRGHAAWALGKIGGSKAAKALTEALASEKNAEVLKEITQALTGMVNEDDLG